MRWLREGNWWALVLAALLSGLLIWWHNYSVEQERLAKNSEPIENWVDFRSANIPDFVQGDEGKTLVMYDMEFKRPFTMHWTVEAASVTTEVRNFRCQASGVSAFKPGDTLPPDGVSLEYIFRSRPCKWIPGEFKIETAMEIHREGGYDTAIISRSSNPFRVLPEGAQFYVTPEQVQKLEEAQ